MWRLSYLFDCVDMYIPVLGAHAVKQSSAYAMQGHYEPSRLNAFMYQRLMARNSS